MNDLNAQQVVLLTLLVSFVTSIATGITTVSLLEQAPAPVTQTINRIVEKTVERVLPQTEEDNGVTVVKTPEKEIITKVVKEEDLVIDAVDKNSRSLARVYQRNGATEDFVTLGIVFDVAGRLVVDASKISANSKYVAVYQSGKFDLEISYKESNSPYAILKLKDEQNPPNFSPAVFSDSQNIKLAQSVILLSGIATNNVSAGIVSNLETEDGKLTDEEVTAGKTPDKQIKLIEASISGANVLSGSVILNLSGEIIGARLNSDPIRVNTFLPSSNVKAFLNGK